MLHRARALTATLLTIAGGSSISAQAPAKPAPQSNFCAAPARIASPDSLPDLRPPLVPLPKVVRGLYVNRWAALGDRGWELIGVASRTEVNALVVDVKDDRGFV
ncbi:MAG: hypothetical protein ABI884_00835, partial [Gemmatimonadota bacterium]